MRLVRQACDRLGIYLVNSINPFRIEGQKTIVWELLQDLEWNAPDWIVVPAGNLGNTSAFGKALHEAHAYGWIDRVPRLAATLAGVKKLGLTGRVVCVLTGHVLKDTDAVMKNAPPDQIIEIDPTIDEVRRVLSDA